MDGYKVVVQKLTIFLYASNKYLEYISKASENTKHSEKNLTTEMQEGGGAKMVA